MYVCHALIDASQSYEAEVDVVCQFIVNTITNNGVDNACIAAVDFNCNDATIELDRKCVAIRDMINSLELTSKAMQYIHVPIHK